MKKLFAVPVISNPAALALLILRIVAGIAFMLHGWGKIQNPFAWMGPEAPVPGFLQFLAAFSEFGGGLAWIIGLLVPLASLGLVITMAVAVSMHMFAMGDPFVASAPGGSSYEPAAVYFVISLFLMLGGPGQFSIDRFVFGKK